MNLALSHRRRKKPAASVDDVKQRLGAEPEDPGAGPEPQLLSQERISEVQSALAELGEEHRQILVLREMESFSYESIADILGLPVGTVRSRLFRARMQLKEKLRCVWGEQSQQTG